MHFAIHGTVSLDIAVALLNRDLISASGIRSVAGLFPDSQFIRGVSIIKIYIFTLIADDINRTFSGYGKNCACNLGSIAVFDQSV